MYRIILFVFFLCDISCLSADAPNKMLRKFPKSSRSNGVLLSQSRNPVKPKSQAVAESAKPLTGSISGHDYVDLGLSVKWATCKVGASSPSGYGSYFAWGETSDLANWGGSWRLPTKAEIDELVNKCKKEWTVQDGNEGYIVIGNNGKSIFLPAAGWYGGSSSLYVGVLGYYWSSSPRSVESGTSSAVGVRRVYWSSDGNVDDSAYGLCFGSDYFDSYFHSRQYRHSVRLVSE